MDTSSESDSYDRTRGHRPRGREAHRRPDRDRGRASGSGGDDRAADISKKISTLANTLQDTSRNLTKVDRMLGQYREHTDDQAEAMSLLRENLEESISQLQTQRLSRSNGIRSASASASTLHTSDLEACSGSEGQRFYPTSPLRDYTGTQGRKRRSQSAGVRFKDTSLTGEDLHSLHQSLRDLRCDQQRLSDDLDREILRRNRSDIDTRRAMESLTGHMTAPQREDSVSSRVERRLQELEREMHAEERSVVRGRRPEQRVAMSDELQETLGRHQAQTHEREETMTARLLKAEREKSKMEQELEKARRLLEKSEDNRETLVQQVEDMRGELLRTQKEKTELQRAWLETAQPTAQPHGNHTDREEGRGGLRGPDRLDLEKEVAELRVQLRKASVLSEVEELKRALDRKEKERVQLSLQVEELSSDLARREQQQLRMLEQLKEIQSQGQTERRETEVLLQESIRSRDELKTRAQEAVRQWRAKCKRLQKELEEARAQAQFHTDKASQAAREKESSQAQLKALSQQTEAARRELAEILGRLAQREEELHRKDVDLSETCQRQLSLEQEIREVREALAALEEDSQRQAAIQARLREENQRLEKQADTQARRCQRDQDAQAELQASLKQMTSAHAQLAQRLAEEESFRKEAQKGASELQATLTVAQEERAALGQQLQLEREVHQKELDNMKAMMEDSRIKKDREVQDMLKLCRQERDEIQSHLKEVEADAASDNKLCGVLRIKLDRMKDECDKLAAQLSKKDEAHALLHRKYHLLKQELDDKVRSGDWRHALESELEEKVLRMEAEQEAILTSMGEELDAACRSLARNGEDKLQAISQKPGLVKDPHHWLAETKTKLRWLCEEVRERDTREQRLRKQHQQIRDQLRALRQSRDSEQAALLHRLDQQEKLLHSLSTEKKELLEQSRRKEEEMRSLQDRVLDLEANTRVALDHLESIPEKQCLMENFKDLEESQRQREMVEQRYTKYKEIVWDLQHQLDESKSRIQEYRDEKLDAMSRSLRLAALSSSIKGPSTFLSSSLKSDTLSPHKRLTNSDLDESAVSGSKPLTD
ncbi:centrosomal protein of 128 kDa [Toxotes jaculatrix]|uniref:centrosomal protein of 128 kDa n=1 Tax=Toxotes jaculatrix TaxID=941984 RepID=UPI001B3B1825|nr:centrosomal protein of 128 kDa [Toxotes jaculatrix]XP_040921072.1 centrosomal protein of 128 kDa [Toxotes jaculatrix]